MAIRLSRLELYRQFTGAEDFLSSVAILGRKIIGSHEPSAILPLPATGEVDEESGLRYRETIALSKRLVKVYSENELKLELLDRRMPYELNPNFHNVASKLFARNTRIYRPTNKPGEETEVPAYREKPLVHAFDSIGHNYDEFDQENVKVYFNHIQPVADIEHEGVLVVGLGLDPSKKSTHMLIDQSKESLRRLWSIKNGRRTAYPYAPPQLSVPFAEIPLDTESEQMDKFFNEINKNLPLQLIMGGLRQSISS